MAAKHLELGAWGEEVAARTYQRRGYTMLARNWRCRDGELDLVLERRGQLIVAEVKTRRTAAFGHPIEAVTAAKQARIHRLAGAWRNEQRRRWERTRFDVVTVLGGKVEIHENAF